MSNKLFISGNTKHTLEELRLTGVYTITNKLNHKFYVGSASIVDKKAKASGFYKRFKDHIWSLKKQEHHNKYLQNSVNKYGIENFKFSILHFCEPEDCLQFEQLYINFLWPHYNIDKVAKGSRGHEVSKETRQKISNGNKGKIHTAEHRKIHADAVSLPFKLISPEGILFEGKNLREFADANNLHHTALYQVHLGKTRHHKGWTISLENHNLYLEAYEMRGISFYKANSTWQISYKLNDKRCCKRFLTFEEAKLHRDSIESTGYKYKIKSKHKTTNLDETKS
jgi:group I intron endonuclease